MPKPVAVEIPHHLTQEEAKARLTNGLTDARAKYGNYISGLQTNWNGDRMEFSGTVMAQRLSGRIDVLPQSVRVEIDLPTLLAMMAQKLIPKIKTEGQKLLEKKP
jgi:putative polyhydroxyalkanoate system protein